MNKVDHFFDRVERLGYFKLFTCAFLTGAGLAFGGELLKMVMEMLFFFMEGCGL